MSCNILFRSTSIVSIKREFISSNETGAIFKKVLRQQEVET